MKPLYFFLMLILILPGVAHAAEEDHLKIIPVAHRAAVNEIDNPDALESLTSPSQIVKVDRANETTSVVPEKGVVVTASTSRDEGKEMVKDAIKETPQEWADEALSQNWGVKLGSLPDEVSAQTFPVNNNLNWCGINWYVNPAHSNTWVDDQNNLHMRLEKINDRWCGSLLESNPTFKYGKFTWVISSSSLNLERNTTVGLFIYHDDRNELDIEINQWPGTDQHLYFVNQPGSVEDHPENISYGVFSSNPHLNDKNIVYSIEWTPDYVYYSAAAEDGTIILDWTYSNPEGIPAINSTVCMDILPLAGRYYPASGNAAEIVLSSFTYTPYDSSWTEPKQKPVASFSASSTSGSAPLKVAFTDQSTGAPTSWNWNFGDGTSSTEKNPTHTYSTASTSRDEGKEMVKDAIKETPQEWADEALSQNWGVKLGSLPDEVSASPSAKLINSIAAADDMKNPDEIDNITTPHQSIRVDNSNETVTLSPRNGVYVTKSTKMSAGAQMIKDGIENTIIDNINNLFVSVGGMQLGDVEGKDRTQTAIFAVTAHTIDPTKDPEMMSRINVLRDIYISVILIFGAALALFLIYQSACPEDSAEFLSDFNGRKYIAPAEMGSYFVRTCAWLLFGPTLFFGSLIINNALVEDQMLSTLDQVTLSSDSLGLYLTFCILWLCSILFFSIRLMMILISAHIWIMYGLPFAFKKTRWAAILVTSAIIVMIFSQFAIVWVCCTVVDYTTSQTLAWYSVSFIYLGLLATVVMMEFLFLTWPVLWKALSPKTLKTAVRLARRF